ncbi:MAG: hypothetical protein LBK60_04250 [Verrucomicrobiales bacterium]|nr:hypothetical protein [Verrucomicrobiales bacterium]
MDTPWSAAADRLEQNGWLSAADADRLRFLWWFGNAIANSDRHYGNVSLQLTDTRPLTLTPAYDTLPMLYSPSVTGELIPREFTPTLPPPREAAVCQRATAAGLQFWQQVRVDHRLSENFRAIAADSERKLQAFARRLDS